jgi:lipopolysaccharide/colanic/teichoic acid biosynthesis glycosyltransferase
MIDHADKQGPNLTVGADPRITRSGKILRKYKLDELPQLIEVLMGDMSLVGPRPEVPHFVAYYTEEDRRTVLSVLPGITDCAAIRFRDEQALLAGAQDPEYMYVTQILPIKIGYYREYIAERSLWGDIRIILSTVAALVWKGKRQLSDMAQQRTDSSIHGISRRD